jgi:uncharacterized protein involved in high-affinity Fe2+ transport
MHFMSPRALLAAVLLVGLAGCGQAASTDAAAEPEQAAEPLTTDTFLPALQKAARGQKTVHMTMDMSGPQKMSIEGDARLEARDSALRMSMEGPAFGGKARLVMVDETLYLSIPGMVQKGSFVAVDAKDKNNPMAQAFGDMTKSMDPQQMFAGFDAGLKDVEFLEKEKVDGEQMEHYEVTLDFRAAAKATGQQIPQKAPKTIDYDIWLDGDDLMRRVSFEIQDVAMDMTMSDWGEPVDIKAPPPAKVQQAPGQLG